MIYDKKVLAIIPARAGSKGLPGKNIKTIAGKPLIAWTIEEAKKSKFIDRIIVSTDSLEIAKISKKYGAEIPFIRPVELATDTAKGIDIIKHAINFFHKKHEIIILLQPTSPLRTVNDIERAFKEFEKKKAKAIVSVCELEHPLEWIGFLPRNNNMKQFTLEKYKNKNRQELDKHYRYNGAIYIADIDYLFENNGFLGEQTFAYIMSKENSTDIDTSYDFKIAETFLKDKNERLQNTINTR